MFESIAKELAAKYLAGLTPEQIRVELPKWLAQLNDQQFNAAWEVAKHQAARRMVPVR